jgi:hypothetical protein
MSRAQPRPFAVGDPIPKICKVTDVCGIFQWSRRQFYAHLANQALPFPEVKPRIGTPRFRGEYVQAYIDGAFAQRGALRAIK